MRPIKIFGISIAIVGKNNVVFSYAMIWVNHLNILSTKRKGTRHSICLQCFLLERVGKKLKAAMSYLWRENLQIKNLKPGVSAYFTFYMLTYYLHFLIVARITLHFFFNIFVNIFTYTVRPLFIAEFLKVFLFGTKSPTSSFSPDILTQLCLYPSEMPFPNNWPSHL